MRELITTTVNIAMIKITTTRHQNESANSREGSVMMKISTPRWTSENILDHKVTQATTEAARGQVTEEIHITILNHIIKVLKPLKMN